MTPHADGRHKAELALNASGGVRLGTLTLDGVEISTYQWGDPSSEPYVLLAHGWSSYALRFAGWIPLLRSMGYAVVGFDQPAHGLSSGEISHMPLFVETIRRVGHHFGKPAALIGHSLGASATIFALGKDWCPERFVLIAPFVAAEENITQQFDAAGIARAVFAPFDAYLHGLTGHWVAEYNASSRLPLFDAPALVIHDLYDRETSWEKGDRFARLWPGARLFTTKGLGHNRLIDHPSVIAETMSFLTPDNPVQ